VGSQVTVYDGDVEIARDALELAHQGINGAAVLALSGNDLAKNVVALSHDSVSRALQTLEGAQDRALQTTEEAVKYAQQTALNSTAIPQSTLSEKVTKQILIAAVAVVVVVAFNRKK
jgi:hypothetical protein